MPAPRKGKESAVARYGFAFDRRFAGWLRLIGVTPATAYAKIEGEWVRARMGPWSAETTLDNIASAEVTGPYRWYRAVGLRLSFSDRGATFGTSTERGVCLRFKRPIRALDPLGVLKHPGLTLTLEDPETFVQAIRAAQVGGAAVSGAAPS